MTAAVPYPGPPALTWPSALDRWTLDPVILAGVALAVVAYLAGVARVRRAGGRWPLARTASFLGPGLGLVLVAAVWWVGAYAKVLFWDFTTQVTILLIVAPVFLAFGRPLTLAAEMGGRPAAGVRRLRGSRPFRLVAHPAFGPLLIPVVIFVLFFTGLLAATHRDAGVGEAVRVGLVLAGFVVALPLAGEGGPATTSLAIAAGLFLGFLELLLDAIPGILVRLRGDLLASGYYGAIHRPWGPSPLSDQRLGGAILWCVAEVVDLPFLALLVLRWIRVDAAEAARVDRELDAQTAQTTQTTRAARAAVPAPAGLTARLAVPAQDGPAGAEPERTRPWWEIDPDYLGSARAAQLRREAGGTDSRNEHDGT